MAIIEGGVGPFQYAGDPTAPAAAGADAVQKLSIAPAPTAGTLKLSFEGSTTEDITWVADQAAFASSVQTALAALPSIGAGNVTAVVDAESGLEGVTKITFTGTKGKQSIKTPIGVASSTLDGGAAASVAVTDPGKGPLGIGVAKGGLLIDTEGARLFQNTGTASAPVWTER